MKIIRARQHDQKEGHDDSAVEPDVAARAQGNWHSASVYRPVIQDRKTAPFRKSRHLRRTTICIPASQVVRLQGPATGFLERHSWENIPTKEPSPNRPTYLATTTTFPILCRECLGRQG